MNSHLDKLQPYPFARLREAINGIIPPENLAPIMLQIGEPKHPTPKVLTDALTQSLSELSKYPLTLGLPELRQACADWLRRRYDGLTLNPETQILPVLGSREALFSFVQAALDPIADEKPVIVSPNPFYQIYEGATFLGGGEIVFANTTAPRFLPDWSSVPEDKWARCKIVFVCSPDNPTGSVLKREDWAELFALQDQYGFIIASDECYAEIYFGGHKPTGCLQAAAEMGRSFDNIIMFTSLSKRSNAPGLRSGFVAGDEKLLKPFLLYRTYHGSAMSNPVQRASIAAWNDEAHVEENRRQYQIKFDRVVPILRQKFDVKMPEASFYIWLQIPDGDDLAFTQELFRATGVQVLPGRFFARDTEHGNPGKGFVRIALVDEVEKCVEAAERMVAWYQK
ncbi:succinyldiaminopimelate transaminase [Kingella negevensis]|uniref:succinyldiaminopimelate transaminase n=1 Tax=Kingella negevensis TaxID=1522312 RepID=UPI00254CEA5F|nr:succinyldiaminopimelate transaminase [Kingella negevensis]MDK4697500.1 succinyldiaminopimelate transaminase [Kingella negevensis]